MDGIKTEVKTVEAFMGSIVHGTLEKLYKDLGYCRKNSLEEILAYYDEKWDAGFTDDVLIAEKGYTEQNYKDTGRKLVSDYYKEHDPFDQMTILGLETQNTLDLGNGRTYDVRIDKLACVGSTYYVCDYKTNKELITQEKADSDRQLAMYSKWVREKFADAERVVLVWHMLRFGKDVTSERTDAQIQALVDQTVATMEEIEGCTEWPAKLSNLCGWCEYKNLCPLYSHEAALEELPPEKYAEDDGLKLANRYAEVMDEISSLEAEKDSLTDELIHYSEQTGHATVYGDNVKITVSKDKKVDYPKDDSVKDALKRKGLYEKYVQFNTRDLTTEIKKGIADPEITAMVTITDNYSVKKNKRKAEPDE